MTSASYQIPDHLLSELAKGNVVAFVGAGFSSAANFPTWGALIRGIAKDQPELAAKEREIICSLSNSSNFQDLDMAAQLLSDTISAPVFNEAIRAKLTVADKSAIPQEMKDRIHALSGIPFAAIVTTNYDNLLSGIDAQNTSAFQRASFQIMRAKVDEYHRLEALAFAKHKKSIIAPVIKLHGDVERPGSQFVCTREGYRNLLHSSSQYSTFLKTLLATHTVLYLGFSFSDAYINQLRQEVMALYGGHGASHGAPLAYAVMCGVSDVQQTALQRHDGLKVINYTWDEAHGHAAFGHILQSLYLSSNPTVKFGRMLHQRSILWVHTNWESSRDTRYLYEYLMDANRLAIGGELTCNMIVVGSAVEALTVLRSKEIDCIISVYDKSADYSDRLPEDQIGTESMRLLRDMTGHCRPPVLVFGYDTCVEQRRSQVMRTGGRCYTYKYYELLSEMGAVLSGIMAPGTEVADHGR